MLTFKKAVKLRGKELILKMDRLSPDGLNINSIRQKQAKETRELLNEELLIL